MLEKMKQTQTTYVTALLDLREDRTVLKSPTKYFELFQPLADTGIPFYICLSRSYETLFQEKFGSYTNLYVEYLELEELELYKELRGITFSLPTNRSKVKDTEQFLTLMNCKAELLERAINRNRFHTSQFAWIDFGISYILQNIPKYMKELQNQSKILYKPGLYIPGCWKEDVKGVDSFLSSINWRFCGGFFLGDFVSLFHLIKLSKQIPTLVKKYRILSWEVNYFAFFELYKGWKPTWYVADHNGSMLCVPNEYIESS